MARFSCHDPNHVWDLIPCDMVGSLILAAGAALYKVLSHPPLLHGLVLNLALPTFCPTRGGAGTLNPTLLLI